MPVDVLEALACGKPFFATSAGGVPYIVTQDVDGFQSLVGDAEWLFEVLRQVCAERPRVGSMDVLGYEKLRTPYATKRVFDQAYAPYAECLGEADIGMRSLDC